MLFPTIDFAVFFLVVFTGSWLLRPHKIAWRWFILASSCVFYGWWDWNYLMLLFLSIGINWFLGLAVYRSLTPEGERTNASRWLVRTAVVVNLGILGYFKYFDFFVLSWLRGAVESAIGSARAITCPSPAQSTPALPVAPSRSPAPPSLRPLREA